MPADKPPFKTFEIPKAFIRNSRFSHCFQRQETKTSHLGKWFAQIEAAAGTKKNIRFFIFSLPMSQCIPLTFCLNFFSSSNKKIALAKQKREGCLLDGYKNFLFSIVEIMGHGVYRRKSYVRHQLLSPHIQSWKCKF